MSTMNVVVRFGREDPALFWPDSPVARWDEFLLSKPSRVVSDSTGDTGDSDILVYSPGGPGNLANAFFVTFSRASGIRAARSEVAESVVTLAHICMWIVWVQCCFHFINHPLDIDVLSTVFEWTNATRFLVRKLDLSAIQGENRRNQSKKNEEKEASHSHDDERSRLCRLRCSTGVSRAIRTVLFIFY
jgi:hypothetical protein